MGRVHAALAMALVLGAAGSVAPFEPTLAAMRGRWRCADHEALLALCLRPASGGRLRGQATLAIPGSPSPPFHFGVTGNLSSLRWDVVARVYLVDLILPDGTSFGAHPTFRVRLPRADHLDLDLGAEAFRFVRAP